MRPGRIAVVALTGVALVAAGGAAIAATKDDPESAILNDAAKRLNVTPKELADALKAAEEAQLDKAVKEGRLTQEQADRIKQHRAQDGHVLGGRAFVPGPGFRGPGGPGFRHPGPGGPGGPAFAGPGRVVDAAADALGLKPRQLFRRLAGGESLADIAKAQNKDLADVKAAARAAIKTDLDAAVNAGRIDQARADAALKRFDDHFDEFAQRSLPPRFGHGGFRFHHGP